MSLEDGIVVNSKPTTSHSEGRDAKVKLSITLSNREFTLNGKDMPAEEYPKHLKFDFISTFDIKDKDINTQQTYLDKRLVQLQSDYGYYLNGLQKQFTSYLNKQGSVTKELYDKIYTRKTLFENLVNGAFKETGKVIDNESEKLRFIIDGKTSIEASQLSSGEKQLLIILLTVLLEDGREYVLMMDEPEISLHISWQYELLNWILELNPNVQLILTTHSPSIFSDGWGDKAIYMEDITTKK
jgi:predicted ATP-dependent endonuclease of OLD family